MCYVSAEGHSRDARQDEVLVVRRQAHGSNWLVSPEDTSTAVCLRTGTAVELLYVPKETQRRFGLPQETTATFKMEDWWRRDVFVLSNGRKALLRKLPEGQVVRVLSVPTVGGRKKISGEQELTNPKSEVASVT
jgi:hypothetical protein